MNHSSNEEEEKNGSTSPSPSHVNNNNNNNNNNDIECNPKHTINTLSPFQILRKRLSRSTSHSAGSNNHDHSSLVLPPLEPPTKAISVGRSISEPIYAETSVNSPVEQHSIKQIHMEAKMNIEQTLSSVQKLEEATMYIQTLPTFTLNEIKFVVVDESTYAAKANYTIIDKNVLNSLQNNNYITNKEQQREEFVRKEKEANEVSALQYIHSKKIVHSNIHPCNIGFDKKGNIKLINFEHASCVLIEDNSSSTKEKDEEKTNKENQTTQKGTNANDGSSTSINHHHYHYSNSIEHTSCETLKYIAPELLLNKNDNTTVTTTTAVDIYSISYIVWFEHKLYDNFSKEQLLTYVHQKGCRPMFDSQQHCWTKTIETLLKSMWSDVPNERPTSQHVHDVLLKELNEHHHSKF